MKNWILMVCLGIAGCSTATANLQPLPGSLIYGGQPSTRLTKAPVGSQVSHRFRDQFGNEWEEIYIIQSDRSLKLVNRRNVEYPD